MEGGGDLWLELVQSGGWRRSKVRVRAKWGLWRRSAQKDVECKNVTSVGRGIKWQKYAIL